MKNSDLELSPKFSLYLEKQGLLEPLVNALKQFREKENYPFLIEKKQIAYEAFLKSLLESRGYTVQKAKEIAWQMVKEMFEDDFFSRDTFDKTKPVKDMTDEERKDFEQRQLEKTKKYYENYKN